MKYGYVYLTTCMIDGMMYIGKHKGKPSTRYIGSGKLLIPHIKQHGKASFKHEVLVWATSDKELCWLEEFFLCSVDAANNSEFFNITNRSAGISEHDEKTKELISEASRRNWNDPAFKERCIKSRKALWKKNDMTGLRAAKQSLTMSTTMKDMWSDPRKRKTMMSFVEQRRKPKPIESSFTAEQKKLLRIARLGHLVKIITNQGLTFLGSMRMAQDQFNIHRHEIAKLVKQGSWTTISVSPEELITQIQLNA